MMSAIFAGTYTAALACIECCDVLVDGGHIELTARYQPSDELNVRFAASHECIVGLLGWGLPLERPSQFSRSSCSCVQWRTRGLGNAGRVGRN